MTYNAFAARNRLVEKGFTAEQAETMLEVIQDHDESTGLGLATKVDLSDLESRITGKVYAAMFGQTVVIVGLVVTLVKALH